MKIRNRKKTIIFKEKTTLDCSCCSKSYEMFAGTQANRCASYFYKPEGKYAIVCHYGSGFDSLKFDVLNNEILNSKHILDITNRESGQKGDDRQLLVCDKCIEKFLENKHIVEDKEYDNFAVLGEMQEFYQEDPQLYMEIISTGPEKCVALMRKERAKPIEQREQERQERLKTTNIL